MIRLTQWLLPFLCWWAAAPAWSAQDSKPPKVQVYLLGGQSNMEGHGQLASLDHLGNHPEHGDLLAKLKDKDGAWAKRDDVTICWPSKDPSHGPLTVGWGTHASEIGPELMFGTLMGERHEAHVLLIKTAWGGKDMFCDFRSPSAGPPTGAALAVLEREQAQGTTREVGRSYREMCSKGCEV